MRRAIAAIPTWGFLALALGFAPAGAAHAQYFMGGYGVGGLGAAAGSLYGAATYGPWSNMGMTLYDQEMVKSQTYMLNANRYNMMSAGINMMDQQANLMQQEALRVAMQNQRTANQMVQERYNLYTKQMKAAEDATRETVGVPIEALLDSQGRVLWPDFAPSAGAHAARRAAADDAIARAFAQYKDKGQADVPLVVDATQQLHAYGNPALKLLGARSNPRPRAQLVQFLNTLELDLDGLAEPKKK
jgi:hypothetical protein